MHISNKLLAASYHKIKPYIHCLPLRACRTKAVFFVLIIYYWDFTLNRIACRSHTCITPDLNKSNEQVTHFLETVFEIYSRYYRDGAHGRIRYFSLWSDNCGEQFKNKFHFGWGSEFLRKHYLSGIFFNFFAPGHGKGICDSEGGINKHAVAHAALHGTRLLSPWDLYQYLSTHGVCVMSRTANALHSPEERRFHYFYEGVFLNYHPIDLKIDRINCFHSFAISKNEPLTLYSRNTSCFCDSCKNGNFLACLDFEFHGPWHTNVLEIQQVHRAPNHIDLAVTMRAHLGELRTAFTRPYLIIFYENKTILRPTYALIQPAASINLATVRAHVLESFQPQLNYFNNTKVKIQKQGLCNIANHNCIKKHTQLIRFDKICCVCVGTTPAGNFVNAMRLVQADTTADFWVYDFKETYASLFEQYKQTRTNVFGNYELS